METEMVLIIGVGFILGALISVSAGPREIAKAIDRLGDKLAKT